MNITNSGLPVKSVLRKVLPVIVSINPKEGHEVPSGIMVDGVTAIVRLLKKMFERQTRSTTMMAY
jgi:hypothetical protein